MGAVLMIIQSPHFDKGSGFSQIRELMAIETPIAQSAKTRLNQDLFHVFAGPNEIKPDLGPIGPIIHRTRLKFCVMSHRDGEQSWAFPKIRSKP